jgi:UDP-N-acetylmuramoyl-L-alanyl-D-glutamate--2,6-diaminopimelate ligase
VRWHDLLAGLDVRERVRDRDVEVTSITEDSRRVVPGACFAARTGGAFDGHEHARGAVAAGAVALLVERELPLSVPQARVDSVLRTLGPAAARLHGDPSRSVRCLGVTGTAGKTTTTMLLASIARAAGEVPGLIGSDGVFVDGDRIGVETSTPTMPQADQLQELLALMRDRGVGTVAMEVTSRALDQHRVDGTWFAAACFTNLSHEHLDDHGSMASYFEAKASLFDPARVAAVATNLDDEHGAQVGDRSEATGLDVWTYAVQSARADIGATAIVLTDRGASFTLLDRRAGVREQIEIPLLGDFNVLNALAAAATASAAGFTIESIGAGLRAANRVPGRVEPIDAGQPFTVLVDYAHSPGEVTAVLAVARSLTAPSGRVIVVFGCGGNRDASKRPLMGAAAGATADLAIVTSDNPRHEDPQAIVDAVLPGLRAGRAEVAVQLDRRVAIGDALLAARVGDVVVIAGKGAETGQTTGDTVVPFDDRVVAREELRVLGWS